MTVFSFAFYMFAVITVMAGLMVADRLSEATRKIEDLQDQMNGLRVSRDQALTQIRQQDESFAKALEIAAQKLEEMAG